MSRSAVASAIAGEASRIREIDCQRAGLDAGALSDAGGHLVEHRLAPGQQHDVEAAFGESLREGGTDPVGGPGDQCPRAVLGGKCVGHGAPTVVSRTGVNRRRAIRQPSAVRTRSSS